MSLQIQNFLELLKDKKRFYQIEGSNKKTVNFYDANCQALYTVDRTVIELWQNGEKGKYLTRITDIDYRFQKNIRNYSVLDITTGKISEYNNKYHYNIQNPFCEGLSVILEGSHFIVMDEFGHKVIKDIEESGSFYSEGPRKDTILTPVFNEGVAVVRQTINEWNYKIA